MVTFEDIDEVLQTQRLDFLDEDYTSRQTENDTLNNKGILKFNRQFNFLKGQSGNFFSVLLKFLAKTFKDANLDKQEILKQALTKANYRYSYELLQVMCLIDFAKTCEITEENFYFLCNALLTIDGGVKLGSPSLISFRDGSSYVLSDAFQSLEVPPFPDYERRGYCHGMTNIQLMNFPNLYGAYYYIPYQFEGYLEHSVLINQEQGMVYDLADNIAVPLEIWQKYYPEASFMISGEYFQELRAKTFEKYEYKIGMAFLEEVKRMRQK